MLKKTALLAVLGVSLLAPAEAGAIDGWEWNNFFSETPDATDSKSINSSDHKGQSITTGTYDGVVFGYAYYVETYGQTPDVENVKSSGNEGTIESGVFTKHSVVGGKAQHEGTHSLTVQANENKVIFKTGSSFENSIRGWGNSYGGGEVYGFIYGGYAEDGIGSGPTEAIGNEVVLEKNVSLKSSSSCYDKMIKIAGGYIFSYLS